MDKPAETPAPITFPVEIDGQIVPLTFRTTAPRPNDEATDPVGVRP